MAKLKRDVALVLALVATNASALAMSPQMTGLASIFILAQGSRIAPNSGMSALLEQTKKAEIKGIPAMQPSYAEKAQASACSVHPKCAILEPNQLNCCPTDTGYMFSCCGEPKASEAKLSESKVSSFKAGQAGGADKAVNIAHGRDLSPETHAEAVRPLLLLGADLEVIARGVKSYLRLVYGFALTNSAQLREVASNYMNEARQVASAPALFRADFEKITQGMTSYLKLVHGRGDFGSHYSASTAGERREAWRVASAPALLAADFKNVERDMESYLRVAYGSTAEKASARDKQEVWQVVSARPSLPDAELDRLPIEGFLSEREKKMSRTMVSYKEKAYIGALSAAEGEDYWKELWQVVNAPAFHDTDLENLAPDMSEYLWLVYGRALTTLTPEDYRKELLQVVKAPALLGTDIEPFMTSYLELVYPHYGPDLEKISLEARTVVSAPALLIADLENIVPGMESYLRLVYGIDMEKETRKMHGRDTHVGDAVKALYWKEAWRVVRAPALLGADLENIKRGMTSYMKLVEDGRLASATPDLDNIEMGMTSYLKLVYGRDLADYQATKLIPENLKKEAWQVVSAPALFGANFEDIEAGVTSYLKLVYGRGLHDTHFSMTPVNLKREAWQMVWAPVLLGSNLEDSKVWHDLHGE